MNYKTERMPFPGLRPFEQAESDLFFGRKGESDEVLARLLKNRFVTVMGAQGIGKSSLIYCGVLPLIKNDTSSRWKIFSFKPGNDPYGNLAKVLSAGHNKIISPDNPDGIAGMIAGYGVVPGEKVLLVIDQFEELFRYTLTSGDDTTSSERFVNSLVNAVTGDSVNIFTIITMRSDFIGECAYFPGLTQLINDSNYLVPHMGREKCREAIEGPVNYAGAKIDPALVEEILDQAGERTDQLPVLQHAMMRTWEYWKQFGEEDRPISRSDYESVGTMDKAMSVHANEVYEELDQRGREICERMFRTITGKGSDNRELRKPAKVATIMTIAGCTAPELLDVIEKFRMSSRSFLTPGQDCALTEDSIIDLSHESLVRLWDRLREWVDGEAVSVRIYMMLSEASAMYQQGKTGLLKSPDLQMAIDWREQQKPTLEWARRYNPAFERAMVYLRTSERQYKEDKENKTRLQKRKTKVMRIVTMSVAFTAMIFLGFMVFAFLQKKEADRKAVEATEAMKREEAQRLLADRNAMEALTQKTLAEQNVDKANRNAYTADSTRKIAEREKIRAIDSAQKARLRAEMQRGIATRQRDTALMLRMRSVGKAMALKSTQYGDQKDLQTLLAYQAYLFNLRNGGLENDADIYAGLYNAGKQALVPELRSLKGHNGEVKSIAYVPGKKEFFTSGADGKVLKWSLANKEQSVQVIYSGANESTGNTEVMDIIALSPDQEWLACASSNTSIRVIPLKQSSGGYVLSGHKGRIKSLIYSFDGKYLYSAALDGRVLKWDLAAHTSVDLTDGTMKINAIDISSKEDLIAGISSDGRVIVWDPERKSDNFRIETSGKNIRVVKFNPETNMLAVGDETGLVELWDVNARKRISSVKAHSSAVNDIKFNPALKQMATGGNDNRMKIFNIANPYDLTEPPITFTDYEGYVTVMQFSDDGQLILSGAFKGVDNLRISPAHVSYFARDIGNLLTRNMSPEEWRIYVAPDIPFEHTYSDKDYNIKVNAIKQTN